MATIDGYVVTVRSVDRGSQSHGSAVTIVRQPTPLFRGELPWHRPQLHAVQIVFPSVANTNVLVPGKNILTVRQIANPT